ncbi:WecB/TagA/CpsF family glycosyltransferase [Sphingomonas abietis]|uniref:WecB/TagA/CpsF family glycosyltransferase n=1 Tax=Sphingomonas abietis TaxID=3012344 RepID=A0ABY7NK06_9SPHN|nr:WecB/TagA/CpsF family glycosyltransferase [Sphingomonas abietis]WBO20851.1 WecB/TagA/CpsF family glycosyltransferase [Sphingomonas abietis]
MTDMRPAGSLRANRRYGLNFERATFERVVEIALEPRDAPQLYCTCNLNHLRLLQTDAEFRDAYRKAGVITVDSRPIQLLARLQCADSLPLVTGSDLFSALIPRLRPSVDRPFFVTSSMEAGHILASQLMDQGFAPEAIGHVSPPFGFQDDEPYSDHLIEQITALGTTHLFMGVGAPKSERWIARYFAKLPAAHIFCVGAALDFTSGLKNRAPSWLRRFNLEWLHRMLGEPRRLAPRYLGDALFLARIIGGGRLVQVSPMPQDIGHNVG